MTAQCERGMTRRSSRLSGVSEANFASNYRSVRASVHWNERVSSERPGAHRGQELIKNYGDVNILMPRQRARLSEINLTSPRLKSMEKQIRSQSSRRRAAATERGTENGNFVIATDFRLNKHCIVCVYQQNIDFVPRSNNNIHENCKSNRSNDEKCKY